MPSTVSRASTGKNQRAWEEGDAGEGGVDIRAVSERPIYISSCTLKGEDNFWGFSLVLKKLFM